jgi:hypothetical protein
MNIVRDNLMNIPGYEPYCGRDACWDRAGYRKGQFRCHCGWVSQFPADFIQAYEARWAEPEQRVQP